MIFNHHRPSSKIAPLIESIFHYKDFVPDHSIERVVPTGHVFIIFELDGFVRNTFDNDTLEPNGLYTDVWVAGMHRNHISISAHENSEMLVVQFKPYGGSAFFPNTMDSYVEQIISAEKVFGGEVVELRKDLAAVTGSQEKFERVENWLLQRYQGHQRPDDEFISFVELLQKEASGNLNDLVDRYSKSQKQLIDQFKRHLGLTPKYYHRIQRFNDILKKIKDQNKVSWAEVAYSCGFADQSHFIKEFRHFSGFNPSEFIKQSFDLGEANFFPLDR